MKRKSLYIILPICTILLVILAIIVCLNIKNTETDAIKFKKEYESLNGMKAQGNNTYKTLNISKDNPIKYSNYDELLDVINNKTGVIYLGFKECPWCRTALPVLFDVLKDNNINTLYYLNIKDIRDSYVVEDGKLTYEIDSNGKEIKGEDGYFKLLEALDEHLTEYIVSYDGKEYDTNEKRLYAPTVIFVRNGNVLGVQVATLETQENGYDPLTNEEYDELYSIYEDYVLEMTEETCPSDSSC